MVSNLFKQIKLGKVLHAFVFIEPLLIAITAAGFCKIAQTRKDNKMHKPQCNN